MENQTWSTFTHENASYMLKVRVDGDVAIFLTDLRNIWIEHLSTEQLHQRFKVCIVSYIALLANY